MPETLDYTRLLKNKLAEARNLLSSNKEASSFVFEIERHKVVLALIKSTADDTNPINIPIRNSLQEKHSIGGGSVSVKDFFDKTPVEIFALISSSGDYKLLYLYGVALCAIINNKI